MSAQILWSPLQIDLLIHYFSMAEPYPRENSVIADQRMKLIEAGLIQPSDKPPKWEMTEKGDAFVEMMSRTPLPVQKQIWVDPREAA